MRALVVASTVALLAGCGGSGENKAGGEKDAAGAAHYADAVGDAGGRADIRAVDVTSTREGQITFRVALGQQSSSSQAGVDLWLDTDANPETGNTTFEDADGAEYLLTAYIGGKPSDTSFCSLISGRSGCFARFMAGTWAAESAPTARIARTTSGVTISINRSDLGNTDELNFWAMRWAARPRNDPGDRAPGTGTFNYSLALGGPRADASANSGANADKAGGKSKDRPVVLTLASHDYPSSVSEAGEFASAVRRVSGGSIKIDVKYGFRYYDVDYERGTISDVRHDAIDLALVGARAWDAAGVKSFNPLVAPFLVDTYALQRRVLKSSTAEKMLEGVEPLGLVGIALIPGELRRPLGISRALVRPADFRRARIGIRPSGVARATFVALGARPESFPARPDGLAGFDGAESGVSTINNNVYDRGARAITANVVLWPRAVTIVMSRKSYDALTSDQQDALREAGRETVDPLLALFESTEQASLATICQRSHLPLVPASPGDRAALRRAVQPVYDVLERNSRTKELLAEIEGLRGSDDAGAKPLRCPKARPRNLASALEGAWRADVARKELRAAGAQVEQFERAEGPWRVEFHEGRWVARNLASGNVYRGTYTVEGDHVRETMGSCVPTNFCRRGSVEEYTWNLYRDKLTLSRIAGRPFNYAAIAKSFTRVR